MEHSTFSNEYKPGLSLIPLTVELLHSKYYDSEKKEFKKIEFFAPQSSASRLRILSVEIENDSEILHVIEEIDHSDEAAETDDCCCQDCWESHKPEEFTFDLHQNYFTPTGGLFESPNGCRDFIKHLNWLQKYSSDTPGPYKKGQTRPFYYLEGVVTGEVERSEVQVAAGPLNTLSLDALDSITMWVLEPSNDLN